MPRKKSYLTATDCFCGAGGSSQGAKRAGVEVKMALNHWKLAIETHSTNFPDTDHDCTDVSACDPRRYPSTDIAIFSPECTTHSPAGGNRHQAVRNQLSLYNSGKIDPATERSRATMWDVVRFTEYHKYHVVIVENVVEAKTRWGLFDAWLHAMHALGYRHRNVFLNSMHCHPTPQSRDRMYIVFWKEDNRAPALDYTPAAHCPKCSRDVLSVQTWKDKRKNWGKYRQQYVYCCPACSTIVEPYYYAAFNCIDWSNLGTRIGDRKKPLADKTLARIRYGLHKYGRQPIQVANYSPGYCKPITAAVPTTRTTDSTGLLIPQPLLVRNETQTTSHSTALVTSESFHSFISHVYGNSYTREVTEVIGTVRTKESHELISYQEPLLEDCYYRMLLPSEIQRAMAFADNYVVLGTSKDKVKQLGNAVTPPAMEWLVKQAVKSLS